MNAPRATRPIDLERLARCVGPDRVIANSARLDRVNTATYATSAASRVLVRAQTVEEVTDLVRFAAATGCRVYVVSQGRNWGFGSKVPVEDSELLIDLSSMNRIIAYDAQFGTVRVEPGVTFAQLARFLRENGNRHFLNTIGGSPEASVIGNILERGDGAGPYCERAEHACAPEVVLADGSLVQTGFAGIAHSRIADLCRQAVGPDFQALFLQSNLGIVTKLTVFLAATPAQFRSFYFGLDGLAGLAAALDRLKLLYRRRILLTPISFWNDYKQLAAAIQYPWDAQGGATPLQRSTIRAISNNYSAWIAFGGVYVDHAGIGALIEAELFGSLRGLARKVAPFSTLSTGKIRLLGLFNRFLKPRPLDFSRLIDAWSNNPLLGATTDIGVRSQYWRKRMPVPHDIDPDRDRCGVLWNAFLVPYDGRLIADALDRIEQIVLRHGFEPVISFITLNDRYVRVFQQLIFDRDADGDDAAALACHDEVFQYVVAAGLTPCRLDTLHMAALGARSDAALYRKVKHALDPDDIIAPGRYAL